MIYISGDDMKDPKGFDTCNAAEKVCEYMTMEESKRVCNDFVEMWKKCLFIFEVAKNQPEDSWFYFDCASVLYCFSKFFSNEMEFSRDLIKKYEKCIEEHGKWKSEQK